MDSDLWGLAFKVLKFIAAVILLVGMAAAFFAGYLFFQWVNALPMR